MQLPCGPCCLAGSHHPHTKKLACIQGAVGGVLAPGTTAAGSGLKRDVSSESSYTNSSDGAVLCAELFGADSESDSESDDDFIIYVTAKTPEDNLAVQLSHLTLNYTYA